jgi:hypothetical protein
VNESRVGRDDRGSDSVAGEPLKAQGRLDARWTGAGDEHVKPSWLSGARGDLRVGLLWCCDHFGSFFTIAV